MCRMCYDLCSVQEGGELRVVGEKVSSCHRLRKTLLWPNDLPLVKYNTNPAGLTSDMTKRLLCEFGRATEECELLQPHAPALLATLQPAGSGDAPSSAHRCAVSAALSVQCWQRAWEKVCLLQRSGQLLCMLMQGASGT